MDNKLRAKIEKTKKQSLVHGATYNAMVGIGEQYVVPYGIKLGASDSQVAMLSTLPQFIGSFFQLVGARMTEKWKSRKRVVMTANLIQSVLLLPLFLIPFLTKDVFFLILFFSLYFVCAHISDPAWASLMGDVIPAKERVPFFSKRNRVGITSMVIAFITGGLILYFLADRHIWLAFGIVFILASISRFISSMYARRHYEPKFIPPTAEKVKFSHFVKNLTNNNFGNFTLFRLIFTIGIMIATPFFIVYMLSYLHLSYLQYTILIVSPMIVKFFAMKYWADHVQKLGTRNMMYVSIFLICLFPAGYIASIYFFGTEPFIFYILLATEIMGGFAWAGFDSTSFNYLLANTESSSRAGHFAYFNIFLGIGTFIGGMIGALISRRMPDSGLEALMVIFLISFTIRIATALSFRKKIKRVIDEKRISDERLFFHVALEVPVGSAMEAAGSAIVLADKHVGKVPKRFIIHTKETFEDMGEELRIQARSIPRELRKQTIDLVKGVETHRRTISDELVGHAEIIKEGTEQIAKHTRKIHGHARKAVKKIRKRMMK